MTERERFCKTLRREPVGGRVPTFELVFFLTMEALGKMHPSHRGFAQWTQMSAHEREAQLQDQAYCYYAIAKKYHHSAIFIHPNPGDPDSTIRLMEIIREQTGDEFFVMMHGDPTAPMPDGDTMVDFAARMYEEPEKIIEEETRNMHGMIDWAEYVYKKGNGKLLDGFAMCSDYCFNVNPFYSPQLFHDLVAPILAKTIQAYREMGYYTIKHTDGNIMPIVDQMLDCNPHALHSLDPQGGVDLRVMKQKYGDKVCLIGNVNCGLLQTGTEEEVKADVRRALRDGMPGGGYIFSTSNCAYTGMELSRYELMNNIWYKEGVYAE